jgi:hypothetical protein
MKPIKTGLKGYIIILIILGFSSCVSTSTYRYGNTSSFFPDYNISTPPYELMGEMDISVRYSQYLKFIKITELINDKEVSNRNVNSMIMSGRTDIRLSPMLCRALYDVYVKYPDADFIVPAFVIAEQENLFLGKKIKKTARIRVYKFKT